ncbi:unnamed protein product [Clonostachys rosea]|uniref:SRR1-like domain-containing protein n=1 Tax=Bionectria ochroleuca TaxID=29856 RepID=A0ABY6V3J0_BIOOC|nr:unnamed protein product [Clonostachys rosea]
MSAALTLAVSLADLQAEVDRRNNPVLTASMKEDIAYIESLYNSGAKLWTKEMFALAEAELAKQPIPQSVELRSTVVNGETRQKRLPRAPSTSPQRPGGGSMGRPLPSIRYFLYQDLKGKVSENDFDLNLGETVAALSEEARRTLATRAMSISLISYAPCSIDYNKVRAKWDAIVKYSWPLSYTCAEVSNILDQHAAISSTINKVVCFGLGSLAWSIEIEDERYEPEERVYSAIVQHAAALTIANVIGKRLNVGSLAVFCQDPIYNDADKRVLAEAGIQVVGGRGGLGFTYIDEDTVVFSCHPNIPVKQVVADLDKPAILICNEVKEEGEEKWKVFERLGNFGLLSPYLTDHDSPRTREMVKGYHSFPFPKDRLGFGDIQIYVRKDPIGEALSSVTYEPAQDADGEALKDVTETPKDANSETSKNTAKRPYEDINENITDEGAKRRSEETFKEANGEAPKDAKDETPNGVEGEILKDVVGETSEGANDEAFMDAAGNSCGDITDKTAKNTTQEPNGESSKHITDEAAQRPSGEASKEANAKIPEEISADIPKHIAKEAAERSSGETSKGKTSKDTTGETSQEANGETSENVTGETSKDVIGKACNGLTG